MQNKRQLQLGKIIQQALGEVFQREGFSIFGRAMVTVTKVWVAPDMSLARVYLSIFNAKDKEAVLGMIKQNSSGLKRSLVSRIRNKMRKMPEFQYFIDDTLDEVFKMEKLFTDLDISKEEE